MKRKDTEKFTENIAEENAEEDEKSSNEFDESDAEEVIEGEEETEQSEVDDNCDLDESATDSDEDESEAESENDGAQDTETKPKSKIELIKEELLQRYKERQGKQLYIRFPHKLPETQEALEEKVKELSDLVVKVHKPRQRHARFCLVDFATKENRDITLKNLKEAIKKGDLQKYVVNIPKTESEDLVNDLAERKIKSIENKKAKNRLKKATKKALVENNFTSSIVVFNLPKTTSVLQLRELFPNAVDIQIKPGKGKLNKDKSIGAITLPTTLDARNATKNKLSLGGNKLLIKFDNQKIKRKSKSKTNPTTRKETNNSKHESNTKNNTTTSEESVNNDSEPKPKKPKLETKDDGGRDNTKKGNKKIKKPNAKNKIKQINKKT